MLTERCIVILTKQALIYKHQLDLFNQRVIPWCPGAGGGGGVGGGVRAIYPRLGLTLAY